LDVEIFNLEKLNCVEVKEEYHVKISNKFVAFENLGGDDVDNNGGWESSR
jgi:hypothetical protein